MSDLVLEHLKPIQSDVSEIKQTMRDLKLEMISTREILGSLISSDARRDGDIANLALRLSRVEQRLELHDAQ
jgi:hypothetical protein